MEGTHLERVRHSVQINSVVLSKRSRISPATTFFNVYFVLPVCYVERSTCLATKN